jgi:hypothetical protein
VALLLAPYLRKFGQFTIPDFLGARYEGNLPRFIGILAASGVQWVSFQTLRLSPGQVFWVCGACALLTGAYSAISRGRFIRPEA